MAELHRNTDLTLPPPAVSGAVSARACPAWTWAHHEYKTSAELAALRLRGLPTTKRRINIIARLEGWQHLGSDKARKRKGSGGGWEYHVSCLPEAAQDDYCRMQQAASAEPPSVGPAAKEPPTGSPATKKSATAHSARQRRVMEARAVILREVDRRVFMGNVSRRKAIEDVAWRWSRMSPGTCIASSRAATTCACSRRNCFKRPAMRMIAARGIAARCCPCAASITEITRTLLLEIKRDVVMQAVLIAFQCQNVVGLFFEYPGGDGTLAPHRVNGHDGPVERQQIKQFWDRGNLVGFVRDFLLAEHKSLVCAEGRDHVNGSLATGLLIRTPQCFAIDCNDVIATSRN